MVVQFIYSIHGTKIEDVQNEMSTTENENETQIRLFGIVWCEKVEKKRRMEQKKQNKTKKKKNPRHREDALVTYKLMLPVYICDIYALVQFKLR